MNLLLKVLSWELGLQARSFIFPATVVSTAMICGFILVLPVESLPVDWATFFVFMDPAMIGFSFVGAIILMEKSEGTIAALGVSPMKPWVYIASKSISLTLLTFSSGLIVAWVAAPGFNLLMMLVTLTLSSLVAVLIGIVCAARSPTMNKLSITLLWVSMIAYFPLLSHFGLLPEVLNYLSAVIPSYPVLLLLTSSIEAGAIGTTDLLSLAYLVVWVIAGWLWALREYEKNIVTEGR